VVKLSPAYTIGSLADPALRFGSGAIPGLREIGWILSFKSSAGHWHFDLQANGGAWGSGKGRTGPCICEFRLSPFGLTLG
jgi:hypothetical protein